MERGEFAVSHNEVRVFVFEGLVAHLARPRFESICLRSHKWALALDAWDFDFDVCNAMTDLGTRFGVAIRVVTWRPPGFAEVLSDYLNDMGFLVSDVVAGVYSYLSPMLAVDKTVTTVYDPDPKHRAGYGWKCREYGRG